MKKKPMTAAGVRARILRVFTIERRWLGYYMVAAHDLMHGLQPAGVQVADAVQELYERGRILGAYDATPKNQFWWYLATNLLPSPAELAARVPSVKGGLLPCHVRHQN